MKTETTGRNREATEQALLQAVGDLVDAGGFETLGINAIAGRAGVSKMLIYRYFKSLDGLIAAYIRQYDYWINFDEPLPDAEHAGAFAKRIFRRQIEVLRGNSTLRRLYRWELSSDNAQTRALRDQREERGFRLVESLCRITGIPVEELAPLATVPSAAISYLALLEENCTVYNGISLQSDQGWERIAEAVDRMVDCFLKIEKR